jgi:predicted nucleic acid-binding protein
VIVIDASALLEVLLRTPVGEAIEARLAKNAGELHVPHLLDLEIAHALRRYALSRILGIDRCHRALTRLSDFPLYRHPHEHLVSRIWELRANLSAYDACYVALAEALQVPLMTHDQRLANSAGHRADIEVV